MAAPPTLHLTDPIVTERLLLRPFEGRDFDRLFDLQSRPEVTRYLYWEPRSRVEVQEALAKKMASTRIAAEGDVLSVAVADRADGLLVGDLTVMYISAAHCHAEIGYVFHPEVHGRGLATEAALALVDLAFTHLGLHRVSARLDARNRPSAALLERLGLRREAHLKENEWVKGEWTDELIYAVLADEWPAARLGVE